jgi:signal transduction histidine kinase
MDYTKYAVLYVDDEEQALKYFKRGLDKRFRVLNAPSVAQAIAILEDPKNEVGVIITDQRMPGKSGVELLAEARRRWPAIVRVLITAYTEIEDAVAAVNAGAVYKYINKPADLALLQQVLTEALDLHRYTIERDALATTLAALEEQRKATQVAEAQREELQQRLIDASRDAGRAEVATGILHNVGNVLNSVSISAEMVNKTLKESKIANLSKALAMLNEHSADLAAFLTTDDRGKLLPGYLQKLGSVLVEEQGIIATEMATLGQSLEHIGRVVQMQQTYAKGASVQEQISPAELMEDAVRMNLTSFNKHGVQLSREFADVPAVFLDKHRVLQIMINLISNATAALADREAGNRHVTVMLQTCDFEGRPHLRFEVTDNGSGIAPENLTKIFVHGFTTRKDGHGFGLHSSANAAREMGGSLTASSPGINQGATFTLLLPMNLEIAAMPAQADMLGKVAA